MATFDVTLSADTPALDALVTLVDDVFAAATSLAELADRALEDRPELLLQFVRLGRIGDAAVVAGHLRVSFELTEDGRLLMAALGALRTDLRAIERLLVQHLSSPGSVARPGDAESPVLSKDGAGDEGQG